MGGIIYLPSSPASVSLKSYVKTYLGSAEAAPFDSETPMPAKNEVKVDVILPEDIAKILQRVAAEYIKAQSESAILKERHQAAQAELVKSNHKISTLLCEAKAVIMPGTQKAILVGDSIVFMTMSMTVSGNPSVWVVKAENIIDSKENL